MKQSICVKTPKKEGEKTLAVISRLGIINKNLEIQRDKEFIYIPLVKAPSTEEVKTLKDQVADCSVSVHSFPERKKTENVICSAS